MPQQCSGTYFDVVDDEDARTRSIRLFGIHGEVDATDAWTSNTWDGIVRDPERMNAVGHFSILTKLIGRVQRVIGNGHRFYLAHVQITALGAVGLFLEGFLKITHFQNATEYPDYIEIAGVMINGQEYTVRIIRAARPVDDVQAADPAGTRL